MIQGYREFYTVFAKGLQLAIDSRYQHLIPTGSGSYGIVCSAIDSVTNMRVAIKISPIYEEPQINELRYLRELKYLRFFNECPQTLHVLDYYCYPYSSCVKLNSYTKRMRCLYMVTPFYDYDLETIIDAKNYMSIDQIRLILYQLLLSLRYLHSAGFMHRDVKPANVLINRRADVALCDFGLARATMTSLTTYVVTRDYRAPELLVENKFYNNKIDIWSTGVVFAEMLNGSALFKAGSASKLLELILSYLGTPKEEDLQMIEKDSVRQFIQNMQPTPKPLLQQLSRQVPSDAADLLMKLLTFNPNKRVSAIEALNHPFFSDLSSTLQPLTCKNRYDIDWEDRVVSTQDQSVLWTQFLKEQEYYPVVKCRYQAK